MTFLYAQDTMEDSSGSLNVDVHFNAIDSILSASPVVQLTLLLLAIFSILSWSIIFMKFKQFSKVKQADDLFLKRFWNTSSWNAISRGHTGYGESYDSPSEMIFNAGFEELKHVKESLKHKSLNKDQSFDTIDIDNVERSLRKAMGLEITKLEFGLSFLATIGSTSPFIGLFGTVWGIMNAFQKIGTTGAAHLAVVAPGISEALIATAFGLLVAIPAVIFYNQYLSTARKIEVELDHFNSDFLNITKKKFFRGTFNEYTPKQRF